MPTLSRRTLLGCLAVVLAAPAAHGHNNPGFVEVFLRAVPIAAGAAPRASEPFTLTLPERSVELIWKVAGPGAEAVRFALAVDGQTVASGLRSGATSRLFRDRTFTIVEVASDGPVTIEVYASVIDRAK